MLGTNLSIGLPDLMMLFLVLVLQWLALEILVSFPMKQEST